jgi:hypothetical protein
VRWTFSIDSLRSAKGYADHWTIRQRFVALDLASQQLDLFNRLGLVGLVFDSVARRGRGRGQLRAA